MAIKKLTFDEALNTAKDDAYFNWYLTNKINGIFYDLGNKCEATSINGTITFKDGFVSIYGRRIYIDNGTSISISLNKTCKGYVILKVDTINNEVTLTSKEGTSSNYPSLTQANLLSEDGVFEFPMVGYSKTTTSLTLDRDVITYIKTNMDERITADQNLQQIFKYDIATVNNTINSKQHGMEYEAFSYPSKSDSTYKFSIKDVMNKPAVIVMFACCNNLFSVSLDLIKGTTNITFTYNYLGTNYQGYIERSGNDLYIELGSSSHTLKRIYCYY